MQLVVEQAAIHERFRGANAELERRYRELGADGVVPFVCECGDARCTRVLTLTLDEYADVAGRRDVYAIIPGHEGASERVVDANDRYALAKVGGSESRSRP